MTIKSKLLVIASTSLIAVGAYGGFMGGCEYQRQADQKQAIEAAAGHFDPYTAKFSFGAYADPRLTSLVADLHMDQIKHPDFKPEHKPVAR